MNGTALTPPKVVAALAPRSRTARARASQTSIANDWQCDTRMADSAARAQVARELGFVASTCRAGRRALHRCLSAIRSMSLGLPQRQAAIPSPDLYPPAAAAVGQYETPREALVQCFGPSLMARRQRRIEQRRLFKEKRKTRPRSGSPEVG